MEDDFFFCFSHLKFDFRKGVRRHNDIGQWSVGYLGWSSPNYKPCSVIQSIVASESAEPIKINRTEVCLTPNPAAYDGKGVS